MEHFAIKSQQLKVFHYFHEKNPPQMLDGVLNTPQMNMKLTVWL